MAPTTDPEQPATPDSAAPTSDPTPSPRRTSDSDWEPTPAASPDPVQLPVVEISDPTPVPTPSLAAPAAVTAEVEAPEAEVLVELGTEETPLANADVQEGSVEPAEEIELEDEEVPLAVNNGAWALLNLILAICTALASIILLIGCLGKKEQKDDEMGEDYEVKRKGFLRAVSLIPTVVAFVVFILTENVKNPMVFADRYTWVMLVIALTQCVVCVLARKKKEEINNDQGPKALA